MKTWITLVIVALTYIGIALGYWPKLKANRTTIALMGVGLLLLTRQVAMADIPGYLDLDTLILLFSMMIINSNLRLAGFFQLAGGRLLGWSRNPRIFLALEILVTGCLSAFFLNDTICLMFTPLLLDIALDHNRNPIPYLIALATAANIGSLATLTGNPQNMIIGIASGIHYADFSAALVPITLLSLGVIWLLLVEFYPHEFSGGDFKTDGPVPAPRIDNHALVKSIIVVAGMLVAFLAGVPIAEASFLAACALLFTRRIDPEKMFANVDWGILVFFAALFVVTGALGANDISQSMLQSVRATLGNNILGLTALTVILSNLVSNVPAVLVLRPVVAGLANPRAGWLVLASASTLAGNLTLLGSVANLIVAEIAARRDIRLSFWEYTRSGLLITLISLIIGTAWLYLTAWAHVV